QRRGAYPAHHSFPTRRSSDLDNPVPLAEDMPLTADTDSSVAGDLLEIEQLARRSPRANPGMTVTVVRPAALVGDTVDTLVTRHLGRKSTRLNSSHVAISYAVF